MASKLYSINAPAETHTRRARCEEVDCAAQADGFVITVDETTTLGQGQAHYLRAESGRAFTETRLEGLTSFTFPPGEQCFVEHRVPIDRPEFYSVTNRGQRHTHTGPDPWLNDFGTHQDLLARAVNGTPQ